MARFVAAGSSAACISAARLVTDLANAKTPTDLASSHVVKPRRLVDILAKTTATLPTHAARKRPARTNYSSPATANTRSRR